MNGFKCQKWVQVQWGNGWMKKKTLRHIECIGNVIIVECETCHNHGKMWLSLNVINYKPYMMASSLNHHHVGYSD